MIFEVPSFTNSKDMIGQNLRTDNVTLATPSLGVVCQP